MGMEFDMSGGADVLRALQARVERSASSDARIEAAATAGAQTAQQRGGPIESARREAIAILPSGGGLNKVMAAVPITMRILGGGAVRLIRFRVTPDATVKDPAAWNRGKGRHYVWGRKPLQLQNVKPGWFTNGMRKGGDAIRDAAAEAYGDKLKDI